MCRTFCWLVNQKFLEIPECTLHLEMLVRSFSSLVLVLLKWQKKFHNMQKSWHLKTKKILIFFSNRFFFVLSREFRVILRWSLSLLFLSFSFSFSFFYFFFIFCSSKWRNSASTRDLQIWIINWDLNVFVIMLDKIKTFSTEHKRYLILVLTCLLLNNAANEFTT